MSTKSIGGGFKIVDGKVKAKPPRMPPVLASAKHKQAARKAKQWAAKSKGHTDILTGPELLQKIGTKRGKG